MVTQEVKFDLLNQKQDKPILCRYGEDGRIIHGTVINSDDEDHTVNLNNFTGIKIQMYKPDGNFVIKDATVSSGHVVIPIDEQMTASAGTGFMDLKLTANDGTIYTCHATVIIDTPVATDDTITSVSMIDGYVFPDDFQLKLTAGEAIYFSGEDNRTINARATALVEGDGIDITGNTISVSESVLNDIASKQDELIAGDNISIENNVISAEGGSLEWNLLGTMTYAVATAQAIATLSSDFDTYSELLIVIKQQSNNALWASVVLKASELAVEQEIYFPISTNTSIRATSFMFTSKTELKCTYSGEGANKILNIYGR